MSTNGGPAREGPGITWPDGKAFAFAVFDDTDLARLATVRPVYDFLESLGMRTTKSVWMDRGRGESPLAGDTAADPDYVAWTLELQRKGFEIASHGASHVTSTREETRRALDRFREIYGHDPMTHANHSQSAEAIYWGPERITGVHRAIYNFGTHFRKRGYFRGHIPDDPLFWGDLCRERIRYVRNFTFADIDTLAKCPQMPYHDPARPYVQQWFAASEGSSVMEFNERLDDAAVDRLAASGSACIMYTHFAVGFYRDGELDRTFKDRMTRLSRRNGWFVPVAELLDHIRSQRGDIEISADDRGRLERRWLRSKFLVGPT